MASPEELAAFVADHADPLPDDQLPDDATAMYVSDGANAFWITVFDDEWQFRFATKTDETAFTRPPKSVIIHDQFMDIHTPSKVILRIRLRDGNWSLSLPAVPQAPDGDELVSEAESGADR